MNIGDKVKVSDFYREHYPLWNPEEPGIILEISSIENKAVDLAGDSMSRVRTFYLNKYGKQSSYPTVSFLVKFGEDICLVSEFGVQPYAAMI